MALTSPVDLPAHLFSRYIKFNKTGFSDVLPGFITATYIAASTVTRIVFVPFRLIILACFALTACQTVPPLQDTTSDTIWLQDAEQFSSIYQSNYETQQTLAHWRYSAKVGIKTKTLREQANLVWQFADQANQLRLFGPLGVGAIKIEFDQHAVVLSDSRAVLHRGDNAETLLTEIVGWPIPLDAMPYWLFALPTPDQDFQYLQDTDGSLKSLRQLGWQIDYADYRAFLPSDLQTRQGLNTTRLLPRKITATKQDQNGDEIVVKLVTKSWR